MSNYKKYTLLELKILEETFLKNSYYPNQKKIQLLSKILKRPTEKIDNWFKYKRRKLYFNGEISDYKIRKIFTSKENDQLNQIFKHFEKPNNQKSKEISSNLSGITENQVKNWFSNRRRKDRNEKCSSIKLKLKKKSPIKINLLKKLIRAQKNLNRSLKKSLIFEKTIQTNKQVIQTNIGLSLKSEEKNDYRANSNISSQTDSKKEEELTAKIEDMNKPSSNFLSFNYNNCNQNNLLLCKKIQIMNLMK